MTRWRVLVPLVLVTLVLVAVATCGDDAKKPAVSGGPPPAQGSPGSGIDVRAKLEADQKKADEFCRGLLKSFDSRTYDPRRDGLVDALEGEVVAHADGKEARFAFAYDVKKTGAERLKFETTSLPAGFPGDVLDQARRFVNLTVLGAYSFVAYRVPQQRLVLAPDPKNSVVYAPAYGGPLEVSYVLDGREVVTDRAEWTDATHKFVSHYDWRNGQRGRYLLERSKTTHGPKMDEGPIVDFAFDERDGPVLLRSAKVVDGPRAYEFAFTYKKLLRRPR